MKPIQDFLADLSDLDIKLWLDGEMLRCNAPEGLMTSSLKESIRVRKEEIIDTLSNTPPPSKTDFYSNIQRTTEKQDLPLSFAQQRLFFIDQLIPNNPLYNISLVVRITGELRVEALHQGINEIIKRHEALRTVFKLKEGKPIQVFLPALVIDLPVDLIEELSPPEREKETQRLINQEAQKPFDLKKGPLIRTKLLRTSSHEHIFILTIHHIVSDGWSMGVLKQELSILYKSFKENEPSPIPELPIQYSDFAVWQKQWLKGGTLDKQLSYWKKQLADLPLLHLPTDFPRPAQQTYCGSRYEFKISVSSAQGIRSLCSRNRTSLFMTLLAAFKVLLFRYTGQDDITVGSPIAGRNHANLEGLIGFFVNTLVMRVDLSGNPSFEDLLKRVRNTVLDALDHQDLPFEKLVAELRHKQDMSLSPLFQIMFAVNDVSKDKLQLEGVNIDQLSSANHTSKFDLTVFFHDTGKEIVGLIEYNTDLFANTTIERLGGHLQVLLNGVAANPKLPISELPILTASEKNQVILDWNDTNSDFPKDKCIHQLFEEQVNKSPDALAVILDNRHLTYAELNHQANQLASYLCSLEVGPEIPVGICMERSIEMIVGILGILKAGGAYVPLDPSYPKERLTLMLEDCKTTVLITQDKLLASLPSTNALVVNLDDKKAFSQESDENHPCQTTPDNLAYVMYTSGSTGKPKGVTIPHRGVVRLVCAQDYASFDAKKRFLLLAPISFDASTFELWGALLHGASVAVYPELYPSVSVLGDIIRQHSITTLWLTSSLFNMIIDQASEILTPLQELLTGGEALSIIHVRRARQKLPHIRLINGYGPTESTTFTCTYQITGKMDDSVVSVPIGKPIANTEVYILDKSLQPVPVGVVGELYIGGDGLTRGYLNRPELNSEKFISHLFSSLPEAKLYKTGDLVKYLSDGNIEFIGRIDQQVKIRGFRIELGEIETVLLTHPDIREAAVIVPKDGPCTNQLAAYIISNREGKISEEDLQAFLKSKLPGYMIPSVFIFLDQLPITPNGKLDLKSLPSPKAIKEKTYKPPRNNLEIQLVKAWEDVLGTRPVGIDDNFFDLGGHSLLAMEILDRIEKIFHKTLPVSTIFQYPTVKLLREILQTDGWTVPWPLIIPIQPNGPKTPFFCIHGNMATLASYLPSDQPFFSVMPHGMTGKRAPNQLDEMAQEYVKQIQSIQAKGPYFLGGYSIGGILAIEAARLLLEQGHTIALMALIDPTVPQYSIKLVSGSKSPRPKANKPFDHPEKNQPKQKNAYFKRAIQSFSSKSGMKEKLKYLAKGISINIEKYFAIKKNTKHLLCELFLWSGRRIPMSLRRFYHSQASHNALRTYTPKVYPGSALVMHSKDRSENFMQTYNTLIGRSAHFHELPGNHFDILDEPNVQVLAKTLNDYLTTENKRISSYKASTFPNLKN